MTERPSATIRQIFEDLADRIDAGGVDSLTAADAMGRLSMELAELARPDPWGPHWHSVIALGMDGPRFRAMPSTPILDRAAACRMLARRIRAMHRECERHCHTCSFVAILEKDDLYEGEGGDEEKALRMLQGPELLAAVYPCEGGETDNCLIICQLFAAHLKEQWDAENVAPMPGNYL